MIEHKTADTILESIFEVSIGGVTFPVALPKNATIIRLSELVSLLPELQIEEKTDILNNVLQRAKDMRILGDIIALLVCGEIAPLKLYSLGSMIKHWRWGRRFRKVRRLVLYEMSPRETLSVLQKILARQEIGDFFVLTTSLKEANILKKTRGVGTTASG